MYTFLSFQHHPGVSVVEGQEAGMLDDTKGKSRNY